MRWHSALAIRLLFLYIPQVSATVSFDMCSDMIHDFSSDSNDFEFLVKDINTTSRNCSCEFTTNRATVITVDLYPSCTCSQCQRENFCPSGPCFCSNVGLTTTPACMPMFGNPICPGVSYEPHSCYRATKFTLNLSTKPLSSCSGAPKTQKLDITIQLTVHDYVGVTPDPVFKNVRCSVRSATPADGGSNLKDKTPMIIGIVVGVGGAVLLITAIVIFVVVLRRRRAKSNKPHANDASQATPAAAAAAAAAAVAAGEIAAYESYTVPVLAAMAAYDNATIGATSGYQTIAYDNGRVGESSDPYTEVKEPEERGNDNGYDNRGTGRSEVNSVYKKVEKDYDNFSENPSTNVETETTVIDNEFYG